MLVLTRKPGEKIRIGNTYQVEIVAVSSGVVKFAFHVNCPVYLMPGNVEIDISPDGTGGFLPIKVTRKTDDSVLIDNGHGQAIEILVVNVKGEAVRVGVKAPRDVQVHREEVWAMIHSENIAAARSSEIDPKQLQKLLGDAGKQAKPDLRNGDLDK